MALLCQPPRIHPYIRMKCYMGWGPPVKTVDMGLPALTHIPPLLHPAARTTPRSNPAGDYVLYWMTAARRTASTSGCSRAAELCAAVSASHWSSSRRCVSTIPFASRPAAPLRDRRHGGQRHGPSRKLARSTTRTSNRQRTAPDRAARGTLNLRLRRRHRLVSRLLPAADAIRRCAAQLPVRLEAVDANGLIPVADHGRAFPTARGYRAFVQRTCVSICRISRRAAAQCTRNTLGGRLPATIDATMAGRRPVERLIKPQPLVASCRSISPFGRSRWQGGQDVATRTTSSDFLRPEAGRYYGDEHNHPDADCTSRLSPYLHFGHISAHEIFSAVMTARTLDDAKASEGRARARAKAGGASRRPARGFPRPARRVARARLQRLPPGRRNYRRTTRCPPGRGRRWKRTSMIRGRTSIRSSSSRRPRHTTRSGTPRRASCAGRLVPRLHAHALGKEDPRVVPRIRPKRSTGWRSLMNRYSLDGRDPVSLPELRLGARTLRPSLARTPDLRHGPLHDLREREAQTADEGLSRALRSMISTSNLQRLELERVLVRVGSGGEGTSGPRRLGLTRGKTTLRRVAHDARARWGLPIVSERSVQQTGVPLRRCRIPAGAGIVRTRAGGTVFRA